MSFIIKPNNANQLLWLVNFCSRNGIELMDNGNFDGADYDIESEHVKHIAILAKNGYLNIAVLNTLDFETGFNNNPDDMYIIAEAAVGIPGADPRYQQLVDGEIEYEVDDTGLPPGTVVDIDRPLTDHIDDSAFEHDDDSEYPEFSSADVEENFEAYIRERERRKRKSKAHP